MYLLDDKYRIYQFDKLNIVVEELADSLSKKEGKMVKKWINRGYYSCLRAAVIGAINTILANRLNDETVAVTAKELLAKIDVVEKDYTSLMCKKRGRKRAGN